MLRGNKKKLRILIAVLSLSTYVISKRNNAVQTMKKSSAWMIGLRIYTIICRRWIKLHVDE